MVLFLTCRQCPMETTMEIPVVYLVDDNLEFAYLIERYCAACGCQMRHFISIAEALGQLEKNLPQALLLNLMLSSGDGQEFVQTMKHDKNFKHIPVIVFSSLRGENHAGNESTDYFLMKPIMYTDFLAALRATGVLHQAA
jgi:two-component system OmpR family response regulator